MASAATDDDEEITGINVTPLVDVTLVLLIIFMVTTSSISRQEGMNVTKPEASASNSLENQSVLVACNAQGDIEVDGVAVRGDEAITQIIAGKLTTTPELQGILQCDEQAPVGTLVHLIDLLRLAGVKKYAIATRKPGSTPGS